jgi:hypothetical protein
VEENPGAAAEGVGAISKIAGKEWGELNSDAKREYEELNAADKKRFAEEMAAYSPIESKPPRVLKPGAVV